MAAKHAGLRATFAVVFALAGLLRASTASAHGRPPALGSIQAQPGDPSRRVAQATWGMLRSDDGGGRWRWICAASFGVNARNQDPPLALMGDGSILAATYGGLLRTTDGGCTWEHPSEALVDAFVIDVHRVDALTALAVDTDAARPDVIHRTGDGGATWAPLPADFGPILVDRVRSAPSDPSRLYASGAVPSDGTTPRRTYLLRSDDAGGSFEPREMALEDGERLLVVWAIDPRDPDVVYGQVLHFLGELAPERVVRSEDGGRSWETVLAIPQVGGLLVRADGAVYAASRLGGIHRALDGRSFETIDAELAVTCLSEIDDELWACTDERRAGFALARSSDGSTFEEALRLAAANEPVECPRCSPAGIVCPAWAPDVAYDLGLDAALPPGFDPDGGTGAPRDAGTPPECSPPIDAGGPGPIASPGCGCRAGGGATPAIPLAGGWLVLLAWARRRSRDVS